MVNDNPAGWRKFANFTCCPTNQETCNPTKALIDGNADITGCGEWAGVLGDNDRTCKRGDGTR